MVTREPIPARIGRALARGWAKLGWKSKTLLCCVAFLALNLAVVVISASSHKLAKPEGAPEKKTAAGQTAEPKPSNLAPPPPQSAAQSLPPTKEAAPVTKQSRDPKLLPAIRNFRLDVYHPLAIGDVGRIVCELIRVEKIIDDRSCIVRTYTFQGTGQPAVSVHSLSGFANDMQTGSRQRQPWPGMAVQLKGWPTAGKVTGQRLDLLEILFRVTGTSNHKTVDGGSVTIYDMEVVNTLVIGDLVRLPFKSGVVWANVGDNSCVVRPYGKEKDDYFEFVPILVKWLPLIEEKRTTPPAGDMANPLFTPLIVPPIGGEIIVEGTPYRVTVPAVPDPPPAKQYHAGQEVPLNEVLFRVTDGRLSTKGMFWVYSLEVVKPQPN